MESRSSSDQISKGTEATVVAEATKGQVTKFFYDTHRRSASEAASREYQYLTRLHLRLMNSPQIGAPEPLALDTRDQHPAVTMRYVPGRDIRSVISSGTPIAFTDALASTIAEAIMCYCDEFGEPWYDCALRNMLVHDREGKPVLYIVDFGIPHVPKVKGSPVDVSVGIMVGQAIKDLVGPRALMADMARHRMSLKQSLELCKAVVANLPSPDHEAIYLAAEETYYRRVSRKHLKRQYFRVAWHLVAERQVRHVSRAGEVSPT